MIMVKPPARLSGLPRRMRKVFLSGSIENGSARNWQAEAAGMLGGREVVVLNPRKDRWDSRIAQSIGTREFAEQVEWELRAMEMSDAILMHFEPGTRSAITLMELGLYARSSPRKLLVHCPSGFWKKGNVDAVCRFYGVKTAATFAELVDGA